MYPNLLIAVAVVAVLIARQLKTQPVQEDSSLRFMVIVGGIGLVSTVDTCKGATPSATALALIALSLVLAAGLGAVRALSVRMWRDADGSAWRRGTWITAGLWILALASHLGIEALIDGSTSIKGLGSATILLYLAATLGVQREVLRARVANHRMAAVGV